MKRTVTMVGIFVAATSLGGVAMAKSSQQGSGAPSAQPVSKQRTTSATGKIERIDRATRQLTIKAEDGTMHTVTAGPEVRRFDELKPGDSVTVAFHQSIVVAAAPPGDPSAEVSERAQRAPSTGAPGATMSRQARAVVKIVSYDAKTGTVSFRNADGETRTMVVQDEGVRRQLSSVKPGDNMQVTYTEGAAVSVTPK